MNISVVKATYLDDYKINIVFSDKTEKNVDFEKFLLNHAHPAHDRYSIKSNFKKFYIDGGDIVWGKNWDFCFHIMNLYRYAICNSPERLD